MNYCHILLIPLTTIEEQQTGYSKQGAKSLVGKTDFNFRLPFSRADFFQTKPITQKGMSISGYQPKLQLIIKDQQFDTIDKQGQFILKPSPEEYPYLAENEHATMAVMRTLGFKVPANGLVQFTLQANIENAFVIKRFDRTNNGTPIHQEQLDGAMNITDKYGKTGQNEEQYISYERIAKFILKHTRSDLSQKIELFRRIVYAYLLGNNDLHLRNFSLIYNEDRSIDLAPIYDFVSVCPYPEVFNSCYLALPLLEKEEGGKKLADGFDTIYGQYIGKDFIEFGENIGINAKLLREKLIPEILKEENTVLTTYQHSFIPQQHLIQITQCYLQRLRLLQVYEY